MMPMPADVVRRKLEKKIRSMSAEEKAAVLREALQELPGYTSGPYGRLRNWIKDEISGAEKQSRVMSRDSFMVRKQGDRTVALAGPPNCGKSSLLRELTGREVRVGDYPFTTVRPVAGMLLLHGASVQLVEVPGLLPGAGQGEGSGRAHLAAVRAADAAIYMGELSHHGLQQFRGIHEDLEGAGVALPRLLVGTKADLPDAQLILEHYRCQFSDEVIPVSVVAEEGLDRLREALWDLVQLIRVYPRVSRGEREKPIILARGATVQDFAAEIHGDLRHRIREVRVWGPSEKFPGGPVSSDHVLCDGDEVHLQIRK